MTEGQGPEGPLTASAGYLIVQGGEGGGNRSNRDGDRFPESLIYQVGTG